MVREAFSAGVAKVVASVIAEALILGGPMPAAGETASLPSDVQKRLVEYRRCEASFRSGLTPPPGASDDEQAIYDKRVGIERVVVCLFPGQGASRVASAYALDADFDHDAEFIDQLLRDLPVKWLAPYLNLTAGTAKLCRGRTDDGRRQLTAARGAGHPIIRVAAEYLLVTAVPPCSPSP